MTRLVRALASRAQPSKKMGLTNSARSIAAKQALSRSFAFNGIARK
jgi:hypothetical protein